MKNGESALVVLGAIVVGVMVVCALSFVMAIPILYLWNWLCPSLFGLPVIKYWQAWGLNMLSGFLIRSMSTSSWGKK